MRRLLDHAAWLLICKLAPAGNRHLCAVGQHAMTAVGIEWVDKDGVELDACERRGCTYAEQWSVELHSTDHG